MMIRKKRGEAESVESVAVCLKTGVGWDDNGDPQEFVKGEEYFTQGELDPNIFELVEKPVKKTKLPTIKEEE